MISTKDLRLLLLVALVSCCWAAPVGPWTLKSDFENGMRQGWETYPLAEDAGYDPTLGPVMYQGRKALERHKAPNRDGEFRLGFVRKARVIAGPHPHLSFSYCVPSPGPVRLEVGVFSGDTPKLISLIARTGAWAQASVALPGIAGDATIRAISITAVFAAAQEGRQERFLIDDVELSAMREKNLEITQPTNLWDEDRRLHYVRRSYLPGQELAVTTNTSQVNVKLFDPKNRLVAAGYNGFLPGTPHVSRVRDNHEQATVHAEQNAIADAARRGSSVQGCVAYVTHYPCISCAKILAAAGIAEVRYHFDYHNDLLVKPLLEDAGVQIVQL